MAKNLSPKQKRVLYHKIAVLSDILIDTIDALSQQDNLMGKAFKNSLEITKQHCEVVVEAAFKADEGGLYVNDLSKKIDTIMRQNFKEIIK